MNYFQDDALENYLSDLSGLGALTSLFIVLSLVLSVYILVYLYILNRRTSKFERWNYIADTLIRNAIFHEEDDSAPSGHALLKILEVDSFRLPDRVNKLLLNSHFRDLIIRHLITARENMTGTASVNLKRLFKQLELHLDLKKMVKGNSWYLKASGLQYLGIMDLKEHTNLVLTYTNNSRGLIRVEAQNAIVKFNGFEGLRFLDNATFPVTEWQQIKLLEDLSQLPSENFTGIEKWLESANDTVVIFALKLTRNYFRFELYENVKSCLRHTNSEVRRQAIITLKELQTAETAADILQFYESENEKNKLQIVKALGDVGTREEIPFLLKIFDKETYRLRVAAAKSLVEMADEGSEHLDLYPNAGLYPYNEIIRQVKAERK